MDCLLELLLVGVLICITISGTPTASGTFNYTIPLDGGCGTVNATGTITVNDLPTVDAGSAQTVCVGASVTLSGSGATSYSWDNSVTNGTSFTASTTNYLYSNWN